MGSGDDGIGYQPHVATPAKRSKKQRTRLSTLTALRSARERRVLNLCGMRCSWTVIIHSINGGEAYGKSSDFHG